MKKFPFWLSVFVVVFLTGCNSEPPQQEDTPIRPVRFEQVAAQNDLSRRFFSGTTRAASQAVLSFKISGTLNRLSVKVGDRVKSGEFLAGIDQQDFVLKLRQAEAALQQAQAESRNAQARYERTRQLYEINNSSLSELDAARAAAEATEAAVISAENQLRLAQRQLAYTKLSAPGECGVSFIHREINENLNAGTPVLTLACGEQLEVEVGVPESYISLLNIGDKAKVRLPAIDKITDATISEVGITTDKQGSNYPVTLMLENAPEDARAGMSAEVGIEIRNTPGVVTVPPHAVGEDRAGRYVFVIQQEGPGFGHVSRREVSVGQLTAEGLNIRQGLNSGEWIVTAGVSRITDGQKVRLPGFPEEP